MAHNILYLWSGLALTKHYALTSTHWVERCIWSLDSCDKCSLQGICFVV